MNLTVSVFSKIELFKYILQFICREILIREMHTKMLINDYITGTCKVQLREKNDIKLSTTSTISLNVNNFSNFSYKQKTPVYINLSRRI